MSAIQNAILADLFDHPGSLTRDIAARLGLRSHAVGAALRRMREAGSVVVEGLGEYGADGLSESRWSLRGHFSAVPVPRVQRERWEKARAVLADLARCPGSLARDIAGPGEPPSKVDAMITKEDLVWMAHWRLPRAERQRREREADHAL